MSSWPCHVRNSVLVPCLACTRVVPDYLAQLALLLKIQVDHALAFLLPAACLDLRSPLDQGLLLRLAFAIADQLEDAGLDLCGSAAFLDLGRQVYQLLECIAVLMLSIDTLGLILPGLLCSESGDFPDVHQRVTDACFDHKLALGIGRNPLVLVFAPGPCLCSFSGYRAKVSRAEHFLHQLGTLVEVVEEQAD